MSGRLRFPRPGPVHFTLPVLAAIDRAFFLLGGIAAGWLAVLTVRQIFTGGPADWWLIVVLWVVLAYLLLPRAHTLLTLLYVPDYFIGRTRTYEGLLGDPVNLAFVGSEEQIHRAMTRAGWARADELGFRSGLRIITSTLRRRSYSTAPVSPLYLFGGMQDFTYQQEVEGNPARRHHVRFWRTPDGWYLPGGAMVDWLAAGTYDRRVGLSIFTLQITHKIERDIDVERNYIVGTLLAENPDVGTEVIRHFASGYHSRNGGGDAIRTDGDLPIVDVRAIDATPSPVAARAWVRPTGTLGEQARTLVESVRDTSSSNRIKRPLTLYVGYALMLLRVVAAVGTSAAIVYGLLAPGVAGLGDQWWAVLPRTPEGRGLALAAILAAAAAYAVLLQLTFGGHAGARFFALAFSVVGIILGLMAGTPEPSGLEFRFWLLNLGLDIAILVTLSGADVRDFHVRTGLRRRSREEDPG
ncbi:MAG: hypothetical protein JWP66_1359 [Naasia sp.]|nr:hypothetical protein [Naasia sp.]